MLERNGETRGLHLGAAVYLGRGLGALADLHLIAALRFACHGLHAAERGNVR